MDRNKKVNILYIQKPAGGGSVIALYEMIRMLNKSRYNPIVLCYENTRYTRIMETLSVPVYYLKQQTKVATGTSSGVRVSRKRWLKFAYQLKSFLIDDFKVAKRIEKIIKENDVDIIHHNNDVFLSRQGVLANRKIRTPQICHYRSLKKYEGDRINLFIDKYLAKKVNFHIHISNAVEKHFTQNLKLPTQKSKVVRDIVDSIKFQKNYDVDYLRTEFNFSASDIIITNIGRITGWKGQDIFIKAVAEVMKQNKHVKALIVGPYENGVGDQFFYQEIKKLVGALKAESETIFTGHRDDIPEIICLSDIIVHTATEPEPQGLVIVEALMAGKPVIVSDAGGAAELIVNNEGGLKVKPGDVQDLKNAMINIINNASFYNKTKPSILNEFDPSEQIEEIQKVYETIIGNTANV